MGLSLKFSSVQLIFQCSWSFAHNSNKAGTERIQRPYSSLSANLPQQLPGNWPTTHSAVRAVIVEAARVRMTSASMHAER